MKIDFTTSRPENMDVIAFAVTKANFEGLSFPVDHPDQLIETAKLARFDGSAGQSFLLIAPVDGRMVRIVLVGLGSSATEQQKAGGIILSKVHISGAKSIAVHAEALEDMAAAEIAYGALLKSWRMDKYFTKKKESELPSVESLTIVGAADMVLEAWPRYEAVAKGVEFTKELVSEPANIIYPESFVERCQHLTELGVKIRVLDEAEMTTLGMGALLGVGQGSRRESRLLVMEWDGSGGAQERPVCFVGKGVTFDTGGISIKPAAGMEDMKWDMGGAGAVAGTMKALAGRKAKAHVVGICGLVENMPDGNAQRPGDVVTSMSGQTIEVINTDAEGRLVLCDALHWAQENYNPEYVIDLATLTGAIIISLAHEYAGMFSNSDDLCAKLNDAAGKTGDALWRMPIGPVYDKMINSDIADMKNVGPRGGGSITAAQFLHRFIKDGVKWAHLDIAGTVWTDKPGDTWNKGASGFGVKLLDRFIADNFEG